MSFRSEAQQAARAAGGSFKAIAGRQQMIGKLADHLQKQNIQIRTLADLREKHVRSWIEACKEKGNSARTCQNKLSAVRSCLRQSGLDQKAAALDTAKFGVQGASRDGSRSGMDRDTFEKKLELVRDPAVRSVLELQRELGLRQAEGVRAQRDTLQRWEKELSRGDTIRVVEGTKGGRIRDTVVNDRQKALSAVQRALSACGKNGRLIDQPNLQKALERFNNQARTVFYGKWSPHAQRYSFAQEKIAKLEKLGYSLREATVMTSLSIGHGDGRGRWVEQVYSRSK